MPSALPNQESRITALCADQSELAVSVTSSVYTIVDLILIRVASTVAVAVYPTVAVAPSTVQ